MKQLLTLLFLLICASGFSQILKNTNLNLNAGGVIYDVAYDSYYDAYVVVGDFTSINGQPRNNLAFIDANSYALMPQNPITSINGAIRSVELYNNTFNHPTLGNMTRSYLYIGGSFTNVNGNTRNFVARLLASQVYNQQPIGTLSNYNFNPWDAELPPYSSTARDGVHDFLLSGDTLVAVGYFSMFSGGTSYTTTQWKNILPIDADATTMTLKPILQNYSLGTANCIHGIRKLGSNYFIYGEEGANDEFIYELTSNGTIVQDLESCGSEDVVFDCELHPTDVDTLLFAFEKYDGSGPAFSSYEMNGTQIFCPFSPTGNAILDFSTINPADKYLEIYKNYLFATDGSGFYSSKRNGQANVPVSGNFQTNTNWLTSYPSVNSSPCFKRLDDRLFVSSNNLTSVNGTARNGLAIMCLEPRDAEPFTTFDNTACEGDSSIYTIPQTEFANGYRWSFSGTGAMYRVTGTGTAWTPLVSEILSGTNANSIEVYFPVGTTGGTLTVEPFSVCNTLTDYQFSEGQSDVISINPIPDIILNPTHTLNCYSDTLHMVVQTTMPNVDFQWSVNGLFFNNDSILITETLNSYPDSTYQVTLTNTITGCVSTGGTLYTTDLVANVMDTSLVSTNPTVWTCLTDSMTFTSNQIGYSVQWENPANPGTYYSDPFTVDSMSNSYYNMHGIQLSNGCATQIPFGSFNVNEESATPIFVGHPNFLSVNPDDSLSCDSPSLPIQCDVDPAYAGLATAQWSYQGTSFGTDVINLTASDTAGMSFGVKVYTIVTTHNTSFCKDSANVVIKFDFEKPLVASMADETLNCSQSEILLTHSQNGLPTVNEGWINGSGTQTNADTITVTTVGDYIYEVQSTLNGCSNYDTVTVTQTLELDLDMPSDTLICPDEIVSISPIVIGNTETLSYLWSTGSTNATETATGGIDTDLSVTVTTPSGCIGSDTTLILITAPISATITPFAACMDGSLEITSVSGGAGNYQYSLDGTTWQTSTNFPNLVFDDYTISIQDDLGCIYDFNQSLDGTASSVEMQFTASTYNEEGDTIVLVNITDFTGLDSVSWVFPNNANVTYEDDSIVILSIASGGWYDVELIGYIGTDCEYSFIAPIYFGDQAPLFDTTHASNGIQSFVVSPNPTTGSFDVALEFGTLQSYSIVITNMLGQPISSMNVSGSGTIVDHSFTFPVGTVAGTYRIHVISDYDAEQKAIILN